VIRPATSDDPRWDRYVLDSPHAHGYHLLAWRRIVEASFGHCTYYLMSEDLSGRVNGVLPLVRLRSRMFGDFLVSVPYVNYGGPCTDDDATSRELFAEAVRLAACERVQHLEVRMDKPADFGLRVRSAKVSMRLPLPRSSQELWKAFPSKLRSQIKRAELEAMTVRIGREDELDGFYRVFSINMRDLGTPVYSKAFFSSILRELPDSTWICAVYLGDEPVAAGLLVGFRATLEIPWASAQRRYNRLSPNMLLYWSALKFACERGYSVFDFGRSSPDTGPYRFKAQWGAAPVPLHWHYWLPRTAPLPELTPQNPRFQLAVRVWRHLPVAVTRVIGPSIVKNLP
jgi:serine/alanine adding enzyme